MFSFCSDRLGDKPHSCELCSKKFALACNLRAHMKTHEGESTIENPHTDLDFVLNAQHICFFLCLTGEPQEECVRCTKMYIVSAETSNGHCGPCLGIPLREPAGSQFRSSGESEEDEEVEEEGDGEGEGEESSNGATEFSDK